MAENLNLTIFRALISYKNDIWQVETLPGVLLEERKLDILK